jgi:hypothetical protein
MSGWTDAHRRQSTNYGSYSPGALGGESCCFSLSGGAPSSQTSLAVAGMLLAIPFTLWSPILAHKVWWSNGATASGNVDVGVYADPDGTPTLLFNGGSTAQSGTTAIQSVTLGSDYLLLPDSYYLAISVSSATATFECGSSGSASLSKMGIAKQTASAGPPCPATLTLITSANDSTWIPNFGFSERATV